MKIVFRTIIISYVFSLSVGEFQHLLSESTGFIFYGTERYLGCLPPNMLAPINISGMCSFDYFNSKVFFFWFRICGSEVFRSVVFLNRCVANHDEEHTFLIN